MSSKLSVMLPHHQSGGWKEGGNKGAKSLFTLCPGNGTDINWFYQILSVGFCPHLFPVAV